jgi:hypothetical protein
MSFKQTVYDGFVALLNEKIAALQNDLVELRASIENETKSSVGDKYETARAILQTRQAQVNQQLTDAFTQKAILDSIDVQAKPIMVSKGSLVKTNRGYFFISIALGKIELGGANVFSLSPQSPLGGKLSGLAVGDEAAINNIKYVIEEIE